ncbi:DctP family TRAP transporter solute-binding subunit [Wukongibacter baidiensis]|uniref:DctP family TRAP transporter solute-binding subunit n=1 Tax=Wukongibacter baidiensis TaxID=1723361 RepID=UPI003D7F4C2A
MKKISVLLIIAMLLTTMLVGCDSSEQGNADNTEVKEKKSILDSDEQITWKLSHAVIEGDVLDLYCREFAKKVEEKFNGKVKIEVYPTGQLGDPIAIQELAQNGGLQFALLPAPFVGTIIPEIQATGLNFVFSGDREVNQRVLHEGEAVKELNKSFEQQKLKPLDWLNEDFNCWTSNKPLRTLEDFEGFKMRVYSSPLTIANYEALGANPTPIPFAEVYSSLQLNMVEGQENPIVLIEKNKFNEVQDYLTISNHGVVTETLTANLKFFNSLAPEDQERIMSVIPEVSEYLFNMQDGITKESLQKIKEEGSTEIIELTSEQRAAFIEASTSVKDTLNKLAGERGKKIYDLLIEDVKRFEAEK